VRSLKCQKTAQALHSSLGRHQPVCCRGAHCVVDRRKRCRSKGSNEQFAATLSGPVTSNDSRCHPEADLEARGAETCCRHCSGERFYLRPDLSVGSCAADPGDDFKVMRARRHHPRISGALKPNWGPGRAAFEASSVSAQAGCRPERCGTSKIKSTMTAAKEMDAVYRLSASPP
jgi:hypothetical protein